MLCKKRPWDLEVFTKTTDPAALEPNRQAPQSTQSNRILSPFGFLEFWHGLCIVSLSSGAQGCLNVWNKEVP